MLSVGVLYGAQDFLKYISNNIITLNNFYKSFRNINEIPSINIIRTSINCKWVDINTNNVIILTENGLMIVNESNPILKLRLQLLDALKYEYPELLQLAIRGRNAIICFGKQDTIQCFRDANLFNSYDDKTILWWDTLASFTYQKNEDRRIEIGRKGERLTYFFEANRVGAYPLWISLEDNTAGYDFISKVSRNDEEILIIEVKTSEKAWNEAEFYITKNEWIVLNSHKNSIIHLWSLSTDPPEHYLLSISDLNNNIPEDIAHGEWQIIRIPYTIVNK